MMILQEGSKPVSEQPKPAVKGGQIGKMLREHVIPPKVGILLDTSDMSGTSEEDCLMLSVIMTALEFQLQKMGLPYVIEL